VPLAVAGLDSNTRPARPADAAHYFARLRYRHRARPLAAMPAHGGRNPTQSSGRRRTRARTVPRARARCDCLPRPAGVTRRRRRSGCLRGDPECLFEALSTSPSGWHVVTRVCWSEFLPERRSACMRLASVLTANRVGFNEIGTPADRVVPMRGRRATPLPGCPCGENLVLLDFNRNGVMSLGGRQQPAQKSSLPYPLLQLRRSRTSHWCRARFRSSRS
jgi:hypothetical protein